MATVDIFNILSDKTERAVAVETHNARQRVKETDGTRDIAGPSYFPLQ